MVELGGPGRAQLGVDPVQRWWGQGAGETPPQGGGGHFCGQRPVLGAGLVQQCGDVGARAGGVVEVGGQSRPERVGGDVGVDVFGELAPPRGLAAGAGEFGVEARVDELLDER